MAGICADNQLFDKIDAAEIGRDVSIFYDHCRSFLIDLIHLDPQCLNLEISGSKSLA